LFGIESIETFGERGATIIYSSVFTIQHSLLCREIRENPTESCCRLLSTLAD